MLKRVERKTIKEADAKKINVKNPDVLELPEGGFADLAVDKLVSHLVALAKKKGRDKVSPAIQNLIRWNKNENPTLSKKAQSVFDKYDAKLKETEKKESKQIREGKIAGPKLLKFGIESIIEGKYNTIINLANSKTVISVSIHGEIAIDDGHYDYAYVKDA